MDVPVQYVSFKTGEDIYFVPAKTREPLEPDLLYRRCDITRFAFATTAELQDLPEFVGQDRALEAVQFGVGIRQHGFNLFLLGPSGTGDGMEFLYQGYSLIR
jgi:hypothetical protein